MNAPTILNASDNPRTLQTSRASRTTRVLGTVLASCLVVVMAALAVPVLQAHANSAATKKAQVPGLTTSCPAPGTARAAYMPSMTLGSHPTVVYIVNEGTELHPTFGTLKRYDTVTGTKVEIVKMANTFMFSAQVSANGQWLLFVSQTAGQVKLQLIRMDGQDLQTLYCGPGNPQENILSVQWSTNAKYVVFLQLLQSGTAVDVLNMSTGTLQADLTLPSGATFTPRTWLDNTRVYLTYEPTDSPPTSVYLLDTSKGANQNYHNLPLVFDSSANPYCWDFDSSYDALQLYTSACTATQSGGPGHVTYSGPSSIAIHPATGGTGTTIVSRSDLAFTSVRAVTSNTLFYLVGDTTGSTSQNGLWKVGTDGSNPTLLASNPGNTAAQLNQYSQFPWSNVSHAGSQYVLALVQSNQSHTTYTLEYGSLSGGTPFVFAAITDVQLSVVGWTTM